VLGGGERFLHAFMQRARKPWAFVRVTTALRLVPAAHSKQRVSPAKLRVGAAGLARFSIFSQDFFNGPNLPSFRLKSLSGK